jgi:adenine phosphoribosyltransferase
MELKDKIRAIPDFPKKGILFRDITTLLKDPEALCTTVDILAARYQTTAIDRIAGIESRGFILGAMLAYRLRKGFIPIRKPGKLPAATMAAEYELEYGTDRVEMHVDAVARGDRILLVDDLLATGGTMRAACSLVERAGGEVVECAFLIELAELKGRQRLKDDAVFSMIVYN